MAVDDTALKRGDEVSRAIGKPAACYVRAKDSTVLLVVPDNVVNAPFFYSPGKGTTQRIGIVVGETTVADPGVTFTLRRVRAGAESVMLTFTQGAWTANALVSLSTAAIAIEPDDVFTMSITTTLSQRLPALMVYVRIAWGE